MPPRACRSLGFDADRDRGGFERETRFAQLAGGAVGSPCGDETFFIVERGSAQRLPNGNTFMAIADVGELREVTPAGEIVWRFMDTKHLTNGRIWTLARVRRYSKQFIDAPRF